MQGLKIFQVCTSGWPEDQEVLHTTTSEDDAKRFKKIFEPMYPSRGLYIKPVVTDPCVEDRNIVVCVYLYHNDEDYWVVSKRNCWCGGIDRIRFQEDFEKENPEIKVGSEIVLRKEPSDEKYSEYWAYALIDPDSWIATDKDQFIHDTIEGIVNEYGLDYDEVFRNLYKD